MSLQQEKRDIADFAELKVGEIEGFYDMLQNSNNSYEETMAKEFFWEAYDDFVANSEYETRAAEEFLEAAGREAGENHTSPFKNHDPAETMADLYLHKHISDKGFLKSLYEALRTSETQTISGGVDKTTAVYRFTKGFKDAAETNYFRTTG
jgi:hypothetical protein